MAKISIHIPDETLVRVRQHKDSLNISRVCSNALLKEVEIISRVPPMVDETRKLIERLRSEAQVQHVESFDLGVRLARSYLQKTNAEQLSYWGGLVFSEKKMLIIPDEVEAYIEKLILEKRFSGRFHRPSFTKGWIGVMQQSWETVRDKI